MKDPSIKEKDYSSNYSYVSSSTQSIKAGDTLKDYTIIEKIAASAINEVYKAWHNTLKVYVVVKVLNVGIRNRLYIDQSFRFEALIMTKVRHERLPRIYDLIQTNDSVYIVMDFIDGENLNEMVNSNEVYTRDDIIRWGIQICEAAFHLHTRSKKIIHRDIKPSNVMVTPERNIVLIDFNISSIMDADMDVLSGVSWGFSPPEQYPEFINDKYVLKPFDERSDIYSIGATLYFLLTRESPPMATNRPRITKISQTDLFDGQNRKKSLDGLQIIISKAMLTIPNLRFQSAEDMRQALLKIHMNKSGFKKLF